LDTLLARLAREVEGIRIDDDLPRRVEAALRARARRPVRGGLPAWAAIAAAVLVAFGVGTGSAVTRSAGTKASPPPPPVEREVPPKEEGERCDEAR
jgi:hypothetical protein